MNRIVLGLTALSPLLLAAAPAARSGAKGGNDAGILTVTVANVHDARGHVRIGVCTKAEFLGESCRFHAVVPSEPGRVVARIPVQPGTYAIAAYQDSTDAGHLRRTFLGVPRDGTGFSRDPSLRFGPPSFAASAITLGPGDHAVTVTLHYF
ncbi:DUF2141 domain-containing protein [Acetobacteraceae bacterium KSS8]|uniref:DUF2141 domain-containing protein n=1 Tax=Endosaccharibacter trunci TaxID=2812733 RepID=A0ABT1W9H4_9PROT|nr:DUF2141 domain-containing protein [Acetobacteraceae bacterium KSS8]